MQISNAETRELEKTRDVHYPHVNPGGKYGGNE